MPKGVSPCLLDLVVAGGAGVRPRREQQLHEAAPQVPALLVSGGRVAARGAGRQVVGKVIERRQVAVRVREVGCTTCRTVSETPPETAVQELCLVAQSRAEQGLEVCKIG